MPRYKRLDELLLLRGLATSRQKAQLLIRSGNVIVNNSVIDKPAKPVSPSADIKIKEKPPFVSRGGLKLEEAVKKFAIRVQNKISMDIGCSTGGFTDCLLQHGAKLVYAVDVGYGQMELNLRNNPKVILMEKTNARYLKPENFQETPQLVTIDVSFISLDKIIPAVKKIIAQDGEIIALIKPQFELGPGKTKHGVVKDPLLHTEAIEKIKKIAVENGFTPQGIIPSPILGPKGNKEFLCWLTRVRPGIAHQVSANNLMNPF